jgi:ELWxxDGT repeat protein
VEQQRHQLRKALLKDINPGTLGSSNSDSDEGPDRFVGMNGAIYFTTLNTAPNIGGNLWKTNGSAAGTTLVTQLPYPGVLDLMVFSNTLYFITDSYPLQIWKSDGTAAGTVAVTDPLSSSQPLYPGDLTAFNGTLYFLSGSDLWKTDGTESGTVAVTSFGTDPGRVSISSLLAASHSSLYFQVEVDLNGSTQFQLWESDGTTAGTTLLQTLGPNAPTTPDLFVMNEQLYYSSDADGQGWQLWKTNGTPAGTKLVKVLLPGANAYPTNFTNVNGVLYFTANDASGGTALWRSDGTTAGTQQLADFSSQGSVLLDLTNVNGELFFDTDTALWKSDGTQAGTVFVADIGKPALYQFSRQLTALDGMLFFQADDGLHGRALWESDGTAAGTFMVPGIRKEGGCQPGALTVLWNRLFFIADDGIHGFEPWTLTVTTPAVAAFFENSISPLPQSSDAYPVAHSQSHAPNDRSFETASARPSASPAALAGVRFLARQAPKDVDILFTLGWDQDR